MKGKKEVSCGEEKKKGRGGKPFEVDCRLLRNAAHLSYMTRRQREGKGRGKKKKKRGKGGGGGGAIMGKREEEKEGEECKEASRALRT